MKIFERVQKNLKSIGYLENQDPFNKRQLVIGLMSVLGISSIAVQLFYFADRSEAYMHGILLLTVGILVSVSRVSTVFKTATIFIFIRRFEELITQSELEFNMLKSRGLFNIIFCE